MHISSKAHSNPRAQALSHYSHFTSVETELQEIKQSWNSNSGTLMILPTHSECNIIDDTLGKGYDSKSK